MPYQVLLVERLLASLHTVATASFLIAIADAYGYLSTVTLYLARDVFSELVGYQVDWLQILVVTSYVVMICVPLTSVAMVVYFRPKLKD